MADGFFIEVDHAQERKTGQSACGDVFLSQKVEDGERVVSVLADGLGSGIKASVLAHLTATMAARYAAEDADIARAARTILESLPVCSERQIAYSTFTIVDMDRKGETRIVEYDNPPFLLIREGQVVSLPQEELRLPTSMGRDAVIRQTRFSALPGDRIVICSDGVTQAGVGQRGTPLGWGSAAEADFLRGLLKERPGISARQLTRALVQKALSLDGHAAKDDISCGVIYLRKPREVLVFTGASVNHTMDGEMARIALGFEGRKVICGGTTAGILSRELGRPLEMDLRELDPDVPPVSTMEGFDLVTEGAITLAAVARMLDEQDEPELARPNAATRLAGVLLDGDIIHIVAGTRINEALQVPSIPQDLDIRRNILRRLHRVLTEKFLKEVKIRFI